MIHRLLLWVLGAVSSVIALIAVSTPAQAHGGAFREDGGMLPPLSAPQGLPGAPPVTGLPGGFGRRGGRPLETYSPIAWRHWWVLHKDEMLPAVGASTRRDPITGSVEAPRAGTLQESEWDAEKTLSSRIVRLVVEPLLARLAQRTDLKPEVLAAALIAWARCANRPPEMQVFVARALSRDHRLEVRESAVLALGLLRRSDPRRRFPVDYLERVRLFLEDATVDEKLPPSVRVFSALSLALLGDQPCQPQNPLEAARTVRVLWQHVREQDTHPALQHASMIAIGMQPKSAVPSDVVELLDQIARGRKALRRRWHEAVQAHALSTLARLDHPGWRSIARLALRSRRAPDIVKYSAVALLGRAAPFMAREEREDVGKLMRKAALAYSTPKRVRGELLISLGRMFSAAAADPGARIEELRSTRRALQKNLRDAKMRLRPFAAIGLAMGVRDMDTENLQRHELAMDIRRALVAEAPVARGSDEAVAAYVLACGLARADEAAPWMIEQLDDQNRMPVLRAHCALALGLLGRAYKPVRDCLRKAAIERRATEIHLYAVRALTMLGQKNVPTLLERHLTDTRSSMAKRTLVLGLARTARTESYAPILLMVADETLAPSLSSMAIAALGVMADPEPRPSRTRLIPSVNRYLLSREMLHYLNVL